MPTHETRRQTDRDDPPNDYPGDPDVKREAITFEDDTGTEWFDVFESGDHYAASLMIERGQTVPIRR